MINKDHPVVFVLPSLDPDDRIVSLADELNAAGNGIELLVVDDGSCEAKQSLFRELDSRPFCTVLHHEVNRGKGAALKTAFAWLLEKYGEKLCGCVTADGDGQHLVKDILQAETELRNHPDALVLGSRVFHGDDVPWKSRFGNNMTSFMFQNVLRLKGVTDTQTGLRGIPANFMKACLSLPGNRFEFETEMLLAAKTEHVLIHAYPIETVYFEQNSGTHFRPVKDACRIYGVIFRHLFGEFFSFILSSLSSAVLDFALFNLCYYLIFTEDLTWSGRHPRLFLSCFIARATSSVWNFTLNRYFVFPKNDKERQPLGKSLAGYYLLCCVIFVASWLLTSLLTKLLPDNWISTGKLGVDLMLFLLCYFTQKYLIFRRRETSC